MFEFITEALFVFWFIGAWAVLLDVDHIWMRLGRAEPLNITNWPGRCFHHPIIFLLCSIIVGCFIFAPLYGLYVQVSGQIGTLGTLFAESGLIIMTVLSLRVFDNRNRRFFIEKEEDEVKDGCGWSN